MYNSATMWIAEQSTDAFTKAFDLAEVVIGLLGVGIVYWYTRVTAQQFELATQQQRLAMAPELFGTAEFHQIAPKEVEEGSHNRAQAPFVLVEIVNNGEIASSPVTFARLTYRSQDPKFVIDYGKEGIGAHKSLPFFLNKLFALEKLEAVTKDRFGEEGLKSLQELLLTEEEPFMAVLCRDRLQNLHWFKWLITVDGDDKVVNFRLASFCRRSQLLSKVG